MCTTAFPLPMPVLPRFGKGSSHLSRRRFLKLSRARVLHVVIFSLNYIYLGRFPSLEEMSRRPSALQLGVIARLQSLIAVCGSERAPFPTAPGRSGPQLSASLLQMEHFVRSCGLFEGGYMSGRVSFAEDPKLHPVSDFPQLVPYRSLDASRLRLIGKGDWQMESFIDGALWLPFQEPAFLRHGLPVDESCAPNFASESKDENLKLARLWDRNGLLELFSSPVDDKTFCKVFNCYKSAECDRQIGDRRRVNMAEYSFDGPSRHLPPGPLLCQMVVKRFEEKLVASVTDRRDFYHQARVTTERARSNLLPFRFARQEFEGTRALRVFDNLDAGGDLKDREVVGDMLAGRRSCSDSQGSGGLYAGFRSLFQGDHLGVEFALAAHQGLLERAGLLVDSQQIKGHCPFPKGPIYSGLIIDDFSLIGREPVGSQNLNSVAARALVEARGVYAKEKLVESDEKDVIAQDRFKAAGAEVIADEETVRRGFVTVGAPAAKRLALSALSLRASSLPGLSSQLAARLAGNWTSILMYRRCLSCIVEDLFAFGTAAEESVVEEIIPLPRKIARELVLLSALSPVIVSNVAVRYLGTAFATDASMRKGAVVKAPISPELEEEIWLDTDKKGHHVLLDNGFRQYLRHLGEEPVFEEKAEVVVQPKASPLLYFDFVEICGGVGAVTKAASSLGLVTAPPLDLSESRHYDLKDLRLLEWVIVMIAEGRFKSFLVSPPCTTFSPAAYPNLRSYRQPYGYQRDHPRVLHGNGLAFKSLVLLRVGRRYKRPCGGEQPRRSKMRWLEEWKSLVNSGDFEEAVIAACNFGSIHQKEFCFLVHLLSKSALQRMCTRDHPHVRIQGAFTKKSAAYTPELGMHLAVEFKNALRRQAILADLDFSCEGLESVVTNDFFLTSEWEEVSSWFWRRQKHINVLEVSSAVVAMEKELVFTPHLRYLSFVDSSVARGALSKGRSTSVLLQPWLRRSAVYQLGFDLYPVFRFCPTRLNSADDPTREVSLRKPVQRSIFGSHHFDSRILHRIGLKRFAANWVRLCLLALQSVAVEASCSPCDHPFSFSDRWAFDFPEVQHWILDFLHSLSAVALSGLWIFLALSILLGIFGLVRRLSCFGIFLLSSWSPCVGAHLGLAGWNRFSVVAMVPGSAQERKRAIQRQHLALSGDRVALEVTRTRRAKLLKNFQAWLWSSRGVSLRFLLSEKPADPEKISKWLVEFGKEMFHSGKTYNAYAETINAVAGARPQIKRQLTVAWDYAFSWISNEPFDHHPAMPPGILIALMSLALLWGWPQVAAVFGLAWAGVLRIGEVLQATRADLVLPGDAVAGTSFALLKVREPKTRGRHAKHQAARIDPVDVIQVLEVAYKNASGSSLLWPQSSATLRKRLRDLLKALKLPTEVSGDVRPFDLSSFRPGGASWLLMSTENVELVRRRGRWLSSRVMEIYLQEVQYCTYLEKLPKCSREMIDTCTAGFSDVLRQVTHFSACGIPSDAWFFLLQGRRVT